MAIYTVDVYSGSSDNIIRDSHAQGVIVKATQGTSYVNPRCNHQYELAGQLGKLRGLYHYAGGGNPEAEAQYFINNIKNYVGKAVLILDWESYQNASWGNTSWARRFVDEVHRLTGVWCLIYVQESALWQVANCANTCGVWVAKYLSMNWNSWTLPDMSVSSGAFASGDDTIANQVTNGFVQNNGQWQYFENNIAVKNAWRLVDKLWYYLDGSGNMESGWQKINNKWYFLNDQHDGTFGAAKTGWNQINNRWYYMDKDNAWCLTGWQEIDGKKYYFDPENAWMLTGDQTIDGVEYVFADNGSLQGQKQQPVQPKPEPVKKSTLSDVDRQSIENELKPYIQEVVKQELANNGR